jgi:transcriptional regulator with XRE-family HTH domain
LRKFAQEVGVNFAVVSHIEAGERFPPKKHINKFAKALSLTPRQLEALIAVERRGMNPNVLLPEIAPADISQSWIESEAAKILGRYCKLTDQKEIEPAVEIEAVAKKACGLSVEGFDFDKEKDISSRNGGALFGGLYPEGFRGKDRVVAVNTGMIRGKRLSLQEQRVTIAHEVGHYVLHCANKEAAQLTLRFGAGPTFCREAECDQISFSPLEYQASALGACLLMPQPKFLEVWKKLAGDYDQVAEFFKVTESFARLRAQMLNCE